MKSSIPDSNALRLENQRLLWLRVYTNRVVRRLQTMTLDEKEVVGLLEETRQEILQRFPDKESVYRLIYERRFKRVLQRRGLYLALMDDNISEIN